VKGNTKNLSENFKVSEFMCKGGSCCGSGKIDDDLVKILQKIRDHFGKPVRITSAYRCPSWNKKVGGVGNSYHTKGMAADIKVEDTAPAEVAKYAESIGVKGIGLYETSADGFFVHVDTRLKKSFWYGQKQQRRDTFGGAVQKPVNNVEKDVCSVNLPILENGSTGAPVRSMQLLLIHNGFNCGSKGADGNFGKRTKEALEKYQSAYGLKPDGICGAKTWAKLLGV
jgi:hypothetical protein